MLQKEVASEEEDSTNPFNEDGEGEGSDGGEKPADEASGAKEKDESKDDGSPKSEDGDKKGRTERSKSHLGVSAPPLQPPLQLRCLEKITRRCMTVLGISGMFYRAGAGAGWTSDEICRVVVSLGVRYGPGVGDQRKGVIYLLRGP